MEIFRDSCEVTMKNTNQTNVGKWELLVKTVSNQSKVSPLRKYSYDVIVVGEYNFHSLTFLSYITKYFLSTLLYYLNLSKGDRVTWYKEPMAGTPFMMSHTLNKTISGCRVDGPFTEVNADDTTLTISTPTDSQNPDVTR